MKFMNLADEYSNENSKFYILPIEYEKDLTYGDGASKGSVEIIRASEHLEYYDEQFDVEPFEKGIHTLKSLKLNEFNAKDAINIISNEIKKHSSKFVISLGGDHSVTIGCVHEKKCSIIILDAHPDLFHSWNSSQYNHRCVAQRLSKDHKVLSVGIRSMDKDENDVIDENDNVRIIKAYNFNNEVFLKELNNLENDVYVSIDVDCFDPSFIRNTGTPEPGGFFWNDVIGILEKIFDKKNVVGADIVEFAPKENFRSEAFSLAKLCHKIMALKFKNIKLKK